MDGLIEFFQKKAYIDAMGEALGKAIHNNNYDEKPSRREIRRVKTENEGECTGKPVKKEISTGAKIFTGVVIACASAVVVKNYNNQGKE